MKLSAAIRGYFLDRSLELAETTIANYRHYFTLFTEFMGDKDIETVTAKDITKFLTHLSRQRGLSDRTVYDVRVRLSTLWTWATAELEIPNVITGVAKPKYREPEIIPYTRHELHQLLQAAEYNEPWQTRTGKTTRSKRATALRDKAIVLTLVDSGIRASELCNLNVGDFDDKTGRVHIRHGKGDKARLTIVGKRTQKAIWRYVSSRAEPKPTDPLFVSGNGGRLHRGNLYRMIRQWGDRVGVCVSISYSGGALCNALPTVGNARPLFVDRKQKAQPIGCALRRAFLCGLLLYSQLAPLQETALLLLRSNISINSRIHQ